MAMTIEHTYKRESEMQAARRDLISRGASVSLMSFDPSRDLYVFDEYRIA